MRTLKKTLALVLVIAMVLSFGIIGASADFTDVKSDNEYKEAIDVMSAIGVIDGMTANTFEPDGALTREQAAKIIAYMLLGPKNAELISNATSQKFGDVAKDRWSAGYIEYCANVGIIGGVGDNKFDPEGKLTSAAFTKMLLCALGYNAGNEGFTGEGWAVKVATKALEAGVTDENIVISAATPVTRAQAMQLAYKTLKGTVVQYKGGSSIEVNGIVINQGATLEKVTNPNADYRASKAGAENNDNLMQFVEKYFPKLKLDDAGTTTDAFGRPAHKWTNSNETVGTYSDKTVATFTASTKTADVNSALNGYYIELAGGGNVKVGATATGGDYTSNNVVVKNGAAAIALTVTENTTVASAIAALTANGKLVEVFANDSNVITAIVTVEYTVGTVSNVSTNSTATTYSLKPAAGGASTGYKDYANEATDDTIAIDGVIAKGDYVTYVVVGTGATAVAYVYPTTEVTGVQTSYNAGKSSITVSGTTYTVGTGVKNAAAANVAIANFANSGDSARYIFDKFGYAVATTATGSYSDFAYVVGTYGNVTSSVNGGTPSAQVKVVLEDGSVNTYDLKLTKVKTGDKYDGQTSKNTYGDSAVEIDTGDYVIDLGAAFPTDFILVYDASTTPTGGYAAAADAAVATLTGATYNKTYGYSLSNNTITLSGVKAASGTMNPESNYSIALSNVKYDKNSYTGADSASSGATVLVNNNTKFVVFNNEKATATVYTGATGLPSTATATGLTGYAALRASTGTVGTASVVFITDTSLVADTSNYAYVDATKYSVESGSNGNDVYSYDAYLPDGSTLALTYDSRLTDGLYHYNSSNAITGDKITASTKYIDATSKAITAAGSDMISVDSVYYNITGDTQVVYVDSDLGDYTGNFGWVVLANGSNGSPTSDVETIFVTAPGTTD